MRAPRLDQLADERAHSGVRDGRATRGPVADERPGRRADQWVAREPPMELAGVVVEGEHEARGDERRLVRRAHDDPSVRSLPRGGGQAAGELPDHVPLRAMRRSRYGPTGLTRSSTTRAPYCGATLPPCAPRSSALLASVVSLVTLTAAAPCGGVGRAAPCAGARARAEREGGDSQGAGEPDARGGEVEDAVRVGATAAGGRAPRRLVRGGERRARQRRRRLGAEDRSDPGAHGARTASRPTSRRGSSRCARTAASSSADACRSARADSPTPSGRFHVSDQISGRRWGLGCCIVVFSGSQPRLPVGWNGGDRLAVHGRLVAQ